MVKEAECWDCVYWVLSRVAEYHVQEVEKRAIPLDSV